MKNIKSWNEDFNASGCAYEAEKILKRLGVKSIKVTEVEDDVATVEFEIRSKMKEIISFTEYSGSFKLEHDVDSEELEDETEIDKVLKREIDHKEVDSYKEIDGIITKMIKEVRHILGNKTSNVNNKIACELLNIAKSLIN